MAEAKSWAEVAQSESARRSTGDIVNLRLVSGTTSTVRFVGDPVKFFKYFVAGKSAVTEFNDAKCIIQRKFNIEPSTRYAVNVIDRADGKLKILELAPSVLKPVIAWWKRRQHEPGGESGCDFDITVTGQKKNTRYEVLPLDITPFTDAEKELIGDLTDRDGVKAYAKTYDLRKLYKSTPQEEIEAKLFGNGGGSPAPAVNTVATQSSAPAANASAKASGWSEPPF